MLVPGENCPPDVTYMTSEPSSSSESWRRVAEVAFVVADLGIAPPVEEAPKGKGKKAKAEEGAE